MKFSFWKISLIPLAMAGLFLTNHSFAFDDLTTHPALTDEIIDFYNLFSDEKINSEDKETIIQGVKDEDIPPRWINHFYDPIHNIGWTGENTGIWPKMLVHYFSGTVLSNKYPVSSLNWLHNQELQTNYSRYKGNRTWEKALSDYANGSKKEGYYTLGYILHLMEDMAVPDHTRNDPHAHEMRYATGDYGSPLEEYGKDFNRDNLNIAGELEEKNFKPAEFDSVDKFLISLANYSNGHFFSKDTINDPDYSNPKIIREDDSFGYGLDKDGSLFELVRVKTTFADNGDVEKEYYLNDKEEEEILSQYFSRLSREVVIYGAGMIDLFHKEAAAITKGEKPTPTVYQDDKSAVKKILTLDFGNISATGEFFKIISLSKIAEEFIESIILAILEKVNSLFAGERPPELLLAGAVGAMPNTEENVQYPTESMFLTDNGGAETADPAGNEELTRDKITYIQNSLEEMRRQLENLRKNQADSAEPPPAATVSVAVAEENKTAVTTENKPKIFFVSMVYPGFGGGGGAPLAQSEQPQTINLAGESESEPEEEQEQEDGNSEQEPTALSAPDLSAPQCDYSLAQDGCLLATTTVNFSWAAVSGADYYGINKNGEYATTTDLFFAAAPSDFSDYTFAVSAMAMIDGVATTSATSTQTVSAATIPVAINEIAWMGTDANYRDEWLELKNNTGHTLDLSQWAIESNDGAPYIALSGQLAPREYRVLQRRENTIIISDPIGTYGNGSAQWAMGNDGEELMLYFASTTLDKTPAITGDEWAAGENSTSDISGRKTMERIDSRQSGATSTNWATWGTNVDFARNGYDADSNQISGTPGQCNSASYASVNNDEEIENDLTLAANGCYYVSSGETVTSSSTLTIEAGARINFSESGLVVEGVLNARGEEGNPIVFDTFSGEQTWNGIQIYGSAGTSTIDRAAVANTGGIMLDNGASLEITNSDFSDNATGVELYNNSAVIVENVNFASTTNEAIAAYDGSSVTIASSTISNTLEADAVSVYNSTLSMSSTTINTIYEGDGIGVYSSIVSIASTTISDVLSGDGIALYDSEATLENVTVENVSGDGIAVYDSNVSGNATVDGEPVEF